MSTFFASAGEGGARQAQLAADAAAPLCPTCGGQTTAHMMSVTTWADASRGQEAWLAARYECITGHLVTSPSHPTARRRSSSIDDLMAGRAS